MFGANRKKSTLIRGSNGDVQKSGNIRRKISRNLQIFLGDP